MMNKVRLALRVSITLALITLCSIVMLLFTVLTLGLFRHKNFVWIMSPCARLILRQWGMKFEIVPESPVPKRQTVYVMNHTSTIDIFALVGMGLPNTRFFLSGFLRKFPPFAILGYLTGTFWTVRQHYPEKRAKIFQRACETLQRTGQSVALSPEGGRVTTGEIGAFNKGAFHLAAALNAPIQPLFIELSKDSNPGMGWDAKPGTVRIWVGNMIDTSGWKVTEAAERKEEVRDYFVDWKTRIESRTAASEHA